ncbi:MAG: hypothetical protein JWM27_1814 [Gemmatimonadetes bacterium]|nr:hypothetical protein [Gemmatimonadota bacterium]
MKKLTLDLEMLAVETFDTAAPDPRRGTAFGQIFPSLAECAELFAAAPADRVAVVSDPVVWTGMDTCDGGSCLQTCTFNTCLSCTATQAQ